MFAEYYDRPGGTVNYGAGPMVNFSAGIGPPSLAAAQTMTIPNPPVYQPMRADGNPGLELNLTNSIQGDMVAGSYGFNSAFNGTLSGRGRRVQPPRFRAGGIVGFIHRHGVLGADAAD